MGWNIRCLLILLFLPTITIVIFYSTWLTPQQSFNFNSVNERSELFWNKFRVLKGSLDLLKRTIETVKEPNADKVTYCDENVEEDFGKEEEKVFSNRNLFDLLTRKLEDEVLSIMTSTSPCSSTSSSSPSTSSSTWKPSARPSPISKVHAGGPTRMPGGGKDQQNVNSKY